MVHWIISFLIISKIPFKMSFSCGFSMSKLSNSFIKKSMDFDNIIVKRNFVQIDDRNILSHLLAI